MSRAAESRESAATRGDVVAINDWLLTTRLRSTIAVGVFAGIMSYFGIGHLRWAPVALVCVAMCLFSAWARRSGWGNRDPWPFFYLQTLVDIMGITLGIALGISGQPAVLFSMLYVIVVVPSSLASVRAGLMAATTSSLAHLFLLGLQQPFPQALASLDAMLPVFLFFLAAHQCFFYGGHIKQKNRNLAQLAARLETSHERLENLIRIARTLNSTLDADELLARTNQAALEHLRAVAAATFLVDARQQTFRLAATSLGHLAEHALADLDLPIDAFPAVARLEREAVLELTPEEVAQIPAAFSGGRPLSSIHLAGLYRDQVLLGFLAIGYGDPDAPSHVLVVEQLSAIAEHSTIALGNAKLLAEARAASDLKSEFLATVSHELRTPLNVIIGYTEMLLDGAAGALTQAQDDLFRRIEGSGRELFDLIEAVLQVGRLEAGGGSPVLAPVSIDALLKTIEGSIGGLPRPSEIEFEWIVPRAHGVLVTDPAKVALVVRNLVGNAFKFTRSGKVVLRIAPVGGDELSIEVSDTGPGIAKENLVHIFEMFRQLKGSEVRGGVGLGLHIVQQVVRRLGGSVAVDSAIGRGSTFRVLLPRYIPGDSFESEGAAEPQARVVSHEWRA